MNTEKMQLTERGYPYYLNDDGDIVFYDGEGAILTQNDIAALSARAGGDSTAEEVKPKTLSNSKVPNKALGEGIPDSVGPLDREAVERLTQQFVNRAGVNGEAVAIIHKNEAGQLSLRGPDGNYFDMSKHIGCTLYTAPPAPAAKVPEVTQAMVDEINHQEGWSGFTLDDLVSIREAMLSTAPTPEGGE